MFSFFKNSLSKIYNNFTVKIRAIFNRTSIDETILKELEYILISSDVGTKATSQIMHELNQRMQQGSIKEGEDLKQVLRTLLIQILSKTKHQEKNSSPAHVYLIVGVNGSGKTTCAAKLAYYYKQQNKNVLLVAADTFRAAATEQLHEWAVKTDLEVVIGAQGHDAAAVVYRGCEQFKKEKYDILIIDTAGRLQTNSNLMQELAKIKRVVLKQLPHESIKTVLTIDAMLGQNSLEQAHLFTEHLEVDDIILTKLDGTGKGGIIFAIAQELAIPVTFFACGEQIEDFKFFDSFRYIDELLESLS